MNQNGAIEPYIAGNLFKICLPFLYFKLLFTTTLQYIVLSPKCLSGRYFFLIFLISWNHITSYRVLRVRNRAT